MDAFNQHYWYLASGVLIGFLLAAGVLALIYLLVSTARIRRGSPKVKGYLDLIPDLTEEQREQVQTIRQTFLPRVSAIREKLRANRLRLAELLFEEPADRDKIASVANQILARQAELEDEVIEHILEERELLSPSQRKQFCRIILEQFSSGGLGVHDVSGKH